MNELEIALNDTVSYRKLMILLKTQPLPVLRKLAEGKPIPNRIQKAFLLESLAEFYYNRTHDTIACELTEIMYQCFDRLDTPVCPVDFDCDLNVQKSLMECLIIHIQNKQHSETPIPYCEYTCGIVDRYEHDVRMASEMLNNRYSHYLEIIGSSCDRVKYYIRKRLNEEDPQDNLIDDIEYTDADSDSSEEPEEWEIETMVLVSPPKVWKYDIRCPICLESQKKRQTILTNCHHSFCQSCFTGFLESAEGQSRPSCPLCRKLIFSMAMPDNK